MNHENTHPESNSTESPIYHIPETRDYSAETDIDRSLVESKFASGVLHILIEEGSKSAETPIEVHHPTSGMIEMPKGWVNSVPVNEPGVAVEGATSRGKSVSETHPNPRRVIGHPSNTIEQQVRNIAGR
jgi:hypothetical protein